MSKDAEEAGWKELSQIMKGFDFHLVLASREDTEVSTEENNITESWEGYQHLPG